MLLGLLPMNVQVLPVAATGLFAVALCVILGAVPGPEPANIVLAPFADPSAFFLLGGLFIGRAMSRHGLDRRLALGILCQRWTGRSPATVLHTIRKHDAEQPHEQIFSDAAAPVADEERVRLVKLFRRGELTAALRAVALEGRPVSDEAMAMELAGFQPLLVEGAEDNIKVTTAADLALAEFLLARTA